jgi:hypothetical protein
MGGTLKEDCGRLNVARPSHSHERRPVPMTLIPCPECQKPISADAIACPQCGHPLKEYCWGLGYLDVQEVKARRLRADRVMRKVILPAAIVAGLLVGLSLIFIFFAFWHTPDYPPRRAPPVSPYSAAPLPPDPAWDRHRNQGSPSGPPSAGRPELPMSKAPAHGR